MSGANKPVPCRVVHPPKGENTFSVGERDQCGPYILTTRGDAIKGTLNLTPPPPLPSQVSVLDYVAPFAV